MGARSWPQSPRASPTSFCSKGSPVAGERSANGQPLLPEIDDHLGRLSVRVSGADRSCLAPASPRGKTAPPPLAHDDGVGWGLPISGEPTVHRWGSPIAVRVLIADAGPGGLRGRFTASSVTRLRGRGDTTSPHRSGIRLGSVSDRLSFRSINAALVISFGP